MFRAEALSSVSALFYSDPGPENYFAIRHLFLSVKNLIAETGKREPSAMELVVEGSRLRQAGDWGGAEAIYRRATIADLHCSEAWSELGCTLADSRKFSEAAGCFHRALGKVETATTNEATPHEAVLLLQQIVSTKPQWCTGQFSLGCAFEHLGNFDQARTHLSVALQLDPSREAAVQALYARMFWAEQKWSEAIAAADRALAANPDYYLAHLIRAKSCSALSRMPEAVESLRLALGIVPDPVIHSDLLFEMNYLPDTTPETLFAEAYRWNTLYAAPLASRIGPHTNSPDPERRLKIGYVSPDLYQHTLMKFFPPIVEHRDRAKCEVFIYAAGPKSDHVSDAMRAMADKYTPFRGSYGELAERVRGDGIDILVDLAGHTMGTALLAFALKPAPLQVSWMGYAGTTGMPAMDYYLGDQHMPGQGAEPFFAEKLYRLPRVECCYRPIGDIPVGAAPCLERGHITFGCFNNPKKITRQAVMLWSAILHLVPESLLLLKFHGLDTEVQQARLRGWFEQDGIARKRIAFEGFSSPGDYLPAYNRIDIALDTFPYNGSSTTLDALWMGVPVVTLAGRLAVQRAGASILTGAGWPGLVAQTPEHYLKIALFLAAAVPKEPELRADIRKALLASSWMDETALVRSVEDAYRDIWRVWCRTRNS